MLKTLPTLPTATALLLGLLFSWSCAATAQILQEADYPVYEKPQDIPLPAFFRNPEIANLRMDAEGRFLAWLQPWQDRMNVHVGELRNGRLGQVKRLTEVTDRDIAGLAWKDKHLLYWRDQAGDENYVLYKVDYTTGQASPISPEEGVRASIVDLAPNQPGVLYIQHNGRNPQVFDLYRVNMESGETELMMENPGQFVAWQLNPQGELVAATAMEGLQTKMYLYEDENWNEVLDFGWKDQFSAEFIPQQGDPNAPVREQTYYTLTNLGGERDKVELVLWNPQNPEEFEPVYRSKTHDLGRLLVSANGQRVVGVQWTADMQQVHWLDEAYERVYQAVNEKLLYEKDGQPTPFMLYDSNLEETRFLVRTYSDRSRGAYYLYDVQTQQLTLLAELSPWLDPELLAPTQPINFRARDGMQLHGYLTLPRKEFLGTTEQDLLPAVLLVHGGPWARDAQGFSSTVQWLASRGFAVLQVNFRGSTGYGRKYWEASFKQWGLAMQDDLSDGARWLVNNANVDPARVGIMGGSYGGYAVLAGLTFTPKLYACGVDIVGVSNLHTFMGTVPPYWELFRTRMYAMVGDPQADSLLLAERSPVNYAHQIQAPLMVVQGAQDPRVNLAESDQIVQAARQNDVPVTYLVRENEGHGFRNEENRLDMYYRIEDFLRIHLLGGEMQNEDFYLD